MTDNFDVSAPPPAEGSNRLFIIVAAIMGGLVNPAGAVAGALLLAVLENLAGGIFRAAYKETVAFVVLFLILFFRPHGIFGRGARGGL